MLFEGVLLTHDLLDIILQPGRCSLSLRRIYSSDALPAFGPLLI